MATAEFSKFVDRLYRSVAERSYTSPKFRGSVQEELPHTLGQDCGREGQHHVQGVVFAWAQEGWEEALHNQNQEEWL